MRYYCWFPDRHTSQRASTVAREASDSSQRMRIVLIFLSLIAVACSRRDDREIRTAPAVQPTVVTGSVSSTRSANPATIELTDSSKSGKEPDTASGVVPQARYPTADELLVHVRRLPPDSFPQLPNTVRATLITRLCAVPQAYRPAHNVVSGSFTAKGTVEWAVLCSVRDTSQILVISATTGAVVDSLGKGPDSFWIQGGVGDTWDFSRILSVVPVTALQDWRVDEDGQPVPQPVDHDAIGEGFMDKYAEAFYRARGRWYRVQTAD